MPQIDVRISDTIEVSSALADFAKRCERLNIPDRGRIIQDVEAIVYDLERRGKELMSFGTQFRTVKVLNLPNCKVNITATYGVPHRKSPFAWFRTLFAGREVS